MHTLTNIPNFVIKINNVKYSNIPISLPTKTVFYIKYVQYLSNSILNITLKLMKIYKITHVLIFILSIKLILLKYSTLHICISLFTDHKTDFCHKKMCTF